MDKSWITKPRNSPVYDQGVKSFIDFAFQHGAVNGMILCPCPKCGFSKRQTRAEVYDHLICKPFPKGYTIWYLHGESHPNEATNVEFNHKVSSQSNDVIHDPIKDMVNDAFGVHEYSEQASPTLNEGSIHANATPNLNQNRNVADEFYDLSNDGQQPLYEGCANHSKLSFILKLYHIKCLCGMSDKAMTMILELLKDAFPDIKIPGSFYEAKKTITKLGLNYEKIHACPNNCMLYWGNTEDEERQICKVCSTSRWKVKNGKSNDISVNNRGGRKVPAKVVRYFPLKPRLQRLFLSIKTAKDMTWHSLDTNNDGLLRHPRDCEAWKKFDSTNCHFAADPRNVRLALATDGFNPYGSMSQSYSIWPIVLIPYNLPPWMCMKQTSFIISTIIPGKQMPGNDIDVYLQPLIRELKELWFNGVDTYDSFKKEMFKMHAALLWTISDYPGLGNLSGWNGYTGRACVHCNFDSDPCRLPYSRKWCFMGHRRFLDAGHKFRLNKIRFNGEQELRDPPRILSGTEILEQVKDINVTFGRSVNNQFVGKRRRGASTSRDEPQQWKKKSIFFELPYWEHNLLRHNLDVMHIEKNVCDNVLFTLLNDSSRSKDHVNARKDLKHMCCKPDLWPDDNGKFAPAVYTMNKQGKKLFLDTIKNICVPDGYASNISRCIDATNLKIVGTLKSHDSHILLQQFLPLAMRSVLHDNISAVLLELCSFFRQICDKVLSVTELDKLQTQIVVTLCHMEMLFPPSFFTLMMHLVVHLVDEAKLGGPVYYRWMYPIERYLGLLKSYVRNKARPEGSIAEGYIAQEVLTFCSRYFENIETIWNRPRRVDDEPTLSQHPNARIAELFPYVGKAIGGFTWFTLTSIEKVQAHRHVLINCPAVDSKLRAIDIFSLPPGERVIVEWNNRNQPVDSSGGMLAQFLGHIASNCQNFPIGFEKWQKVPECYKDHVWNNIIKTKMDVNNDGHKDYIFKSLAKKWRDHRYNLYNCAQCDPDGSRESNIAKKPAEIPLDQWVTFIDYRARPDIKAKAEKNAQNRTKLTMPHTLGSKSIARLQKEMETQLHRSVTRAELFQVSHTTSDGSFVNDEARQNHEELITQSQNSSENEAFINVFGKEHPGYVRGLGLGVVPTQVYGSSSNTSSRQNASASTNSEIDALKETVQILSRQVEQNQHQIALLNQQLGNQGQNVATNENAGSAGIGRRSSQDSHSAHSEHSSDTDA